MKNRIELRYEMNETQKRVGFLIVTDMTRQVELDRIEIRNANELYDFKHQLADAYREEGHTVFIHC